MSESGSFETREETYLEEAPSPKRARYEEGEIEETTIVQEGEDGSMHITVPQTQFEIEINSQAEGGSPTEGIHQIQAQDLSGPAFGVIQEQV